MSIFPEDKFPPRIEQVLLAGEALVLSEERLYIEFASVAKGKYMLTHFYDCVELKAIDTVTYLVRSEEEQRVAEAMYWTPDSEPALEPEAQLLSVRELRPESENVASLRLTA